ncbi:MAG: glycosyltransferase family 4 protein [Marinomonas colpomeniae]
MRILIVNTLDIQGGAARAAYRLHQSLLFNGIDSQMLVQSKVSDDFSVLGPNTGIQKTICKLRPALDNFPVRSNKKHTKTLFSMNWLPFSNIVARINQIKPDIVHLHWIADGMIRIEDLTKIEAPIVWSLHDMWPFTDGYHYDSGFDVEKNDLPLEPKLSAQRKNFTRKRKTFSKINNMTVVGLSHWLSNCAKNSRLLGDKTHVCLPNPINTKTFSSFDRNQARTLFNLPCDKKLILFGAMGATSDPRKGFKELSAALELLNPDDIELVVLGSGEPKVSPGFKQRAYYLGHLHDDVSLRVLYSAVDVMIVPSLQENLSNAIMEALACSTPVVGFNIGGNNDLVKHKHSGYLARPFDIVDLASGIEWILNASNYDELCQNARVKVLLEFDSQIVAKKYIDLYEHILDK